MFHFLHRNVSCLMEVRYQTSFLDTLTLNSEQDNFSKTMAKKSTAFFKDRKSTEFKGDLQRPSVRAVSRYITWQPRHSKHLELRRLRIVSVYLYLTLLIGHHVRRLDRAGLYLTERFIREVTSPYQRKISLRELWFAMWRMPIKIENATSEVACFT